MMAATRARTDPAADLGPQHQHATGRLEVLVVADPAAPLRSIRQARRCDPLRAMDLSAAQLAAADWHRANVELAEGARGGDGGVGGLAPWQRSHYPALVLDAVAHRREVMQAVGLILSAVFVSVVEGYTSLRDIERSGLVSQYRAARMVREALDRAAVVHTRRA